MSSSISSAALATHHCELTQWGCVVYFGWQSQQAVVTPAELWRLLQKRSHWMTQHIVVHVQVLG
jgi:hypothetical protein